MSTVAAASDQDVGAQAEPRGEAVARRGWYPDPADESIIRWWDGTAWTAAVRPVDGGAGSLPPRKRKPRWAAAAVAGLFAVMLVGMSMLGAADSSLGFSSPAEPAASLVISSPSEPASAVV